MLNAQHAGQNIQLNQGYKMEKIKQEYEKIKTRFNLPEFNEIDKEFELARIDIDKTSILTKEILRIIISRLISFINSIEPVVNTPPQSLHALIEISNLSDDDKREIFVFYKGISSLIHEGLVAEIETEKESAIFITKVWKQWPEIRNKEKTFLQKIAKAWLKEDETDDELKKYMT